VTRFEKLCELKHRLITLRNDLHSVFCDYFELLENLNIEHKVSDVVRELDKVIDEVDRIIKSILWFRKEFEGKKPPKPLGTVKTKHLDPIP